MRRRRPVLAEVLLGLVAITAAVVAAHYALRYGDFYKIGDTEHRRNGTLDALRIAAPLLVAAMALFALLISRLTPNGLRRQYRDEIEELHRARRWSSEARGQRQEPDR